MAKRIDSDLAVDIASADAGHFVIKIDPLFGNQRVATQFFPRFVEVVVFANDELSLAVIAEATCLDNDRKAECIDGRGQVFARVDGVVAGQRNTERVEQALLVEAILRVSQRIRRRIDWHFALDLMQRPDRHVFEFVGYDITACCQFGERVAVIEGLLDHIAAFGRRRRIGRVDK